MSVQFKDYYQTLGVSRSSSSDEIRKAFRKLARQYHPDMAKPKEKAAAETKFKEINEAYEVLGDPEKRKKYDALGMDWDRPGAGQAQGWQNFRGGAPGGGGVEGDFSFGGTGFSDFFEAFFGSQGRRQGSGVFGGSNVSGRGSDIEADISVPLEEVVNGATRRVSFRRSPQASVETYNVRIPAGVREGQRIRLAGQGATGLGGGAKGDLYLNVKYEQHPEFRAEGSDLIHEAELTVTQAVLGSEITVPTLEGKAHLKIPAGTQNGQKFRLKQRGLPDGKSARGDLYVEVEVLIPKSLNSKERELWEQLAALEG